MPMPKLLKRFSKKNLKDSNGSGTTQTSGESQTTSSRGIRNSGSDSDTPPPVPPLPPHSRSSSATKKSLAETGYLSPPVSPLPVLRVTIDDNETSDEVDEIWHSIGPDPTLSKRDQMLMNIEDKLTGVSDNPAISTVTGVSAVIQSAVGKEAIEQGMKTVFEGSKVLMKALDEVAKMHPFIKGAVIIFQGIWALEMKRRENDNRVKLLYTEMRNMMEALRQLKDVKDDSVVIDGETLQGRMQTLGKKIEKDLKNCANTADTYRKLKTIARFVRGPIWEGRLMAFVDIFCERQRDLVFAMNIHQTVVIDGVAVTTNEVRQDVQAIKELMSQLIRGYKLPPDEQKVHDYICSIRAQGKDINLADEKSIKELSDAMERTAQTESGKDKLTSGGSNFQALMADLRADPDKAIEKNMEVFSRKFDAQVEDLKQEMSRVAQREGDRVITAFGRGPHERIRDHDVHQFWKDNNWKGSVKVRYFVMTLRDYFHEKWEQSEDPPQENRLYSPVTPAPITPAPKPRIDTKDEWTLAYLTIFRVQAIGEAFDNDGSGYVSVSEVNNFTNSRPKDWSLPHWIAYWAVGYHQTITLYAQKIEVLFAKMFALLPKISKVNRSSVDQYLLAVYQRVASLINSILPCIVNENIQSKFESYVETEERRLEQNLDRFRYDIDEEDTLSLITGPDRIEKYLLPLLYLILKRHHDIMRLGKHQALDGNELTDAANTLEYVFDAVRDRVKTLTSAFKQQKLDLDQQFKSYAHGLFHLTHDGKDYWNHQAVTKRTEPEYYGYLESLDEQELPDNKILNYQGYQDVLEYSAYETPLSHLEDSAASHDLEPAGPLSLREVLGTWNGHLYSFGGYGFIDSVIFQETEDASPESFIGSGRDIWANNFTIVGEIRLPSSEDDGHPPNIISVTWTKIVKDPAPLTRHFKGEYKRSTGQLRGNWGFEVDQIDYKFEYRRIDREDLSFLPSLTDRAEENARSMVQFAFQAVRQRIRRQSWSWEYFHVRRDQRVRFLELWIRHRYFGKSLTWPEYVELSKLEHTLNTSDLQFYISLAERQLQMTPNHRVYCDGCYDSIGGTRIICLDCEDKEQFNPIDLCGEPKCLSSKIEADRLVGPHLPSHNVVKLRRIAHIREAGNLFSQAKAALKRGGDTLAGVPVATTDGESSDESKSDPRPPPTTGLPPVCKVCELQITQPCWFCVQCSTPTFICSICDSADASPKLTDAVTDDAVISAETKVVAAAETAVSLHHYSHDLVRLQKSTEEKEASQEERYNEMSGRLDAMVGRLKNVEELIGKLMDAFQQGQTVVHATGPAPSSV